MYNVFETIINCDGKEVIVYGIRSDGICIENISCNKEKIQELCDLCNKLSADEIHMKDIVEDFIVT